MATQHETELYKLELDRFGFYTLTRKRDGATAFFQGDEASLWSRNMALIKAIDFGDGSVNSLDGSFNSLCSGYDDMARL